MNTTIWWVIKSGKIYLPYTVRLTRSQAIEDYENLECANWARLTRRGFSVVKIKVVETQEVQNQRQIPKTAQESGSQPSEAGETEGNGVPGGGSAGIQR